MIRHLIPFRPFINLVIVLAANGGIHPRKLPALAPWLVKTIVFEPFRILEALYVMIRIPFIKRQPPVFILGYYRSGTTYLQELMRCDPQLATPTIFQTVLPEVMLLLEPVCKPLFQWISRKLKMQNAFHRLDFNWDFPGEEDVAINALSYLCDFNRIYQYPSKAGRILDLHFGDGAKTRPAQWLQAHYYFTGKLAVRYGRRLLLKSPPNTARIALLRSLYPQSKFIFISREKKICLVSNTRLWEINREYSFEHYDGKRVRETIAGMYAVFHARYEREKSLLGESDLVEVAFDDLVKQPEHTIRVIYQKLALEDSPAARRNREKLIQARAGYQPYPHTEVSE